MPISCVVRISVTTIIKSLVQLAHKHLLYRFLQAAIVINFRPESIFSAALNHYEAVWSEFGFGNRPTRGQSYIPSR